MRSRHIFLSAGVAAFVLQCPLPAQTAGSQRASRRDNNGSSTPVGINDAPSTIAPRTVSGRVINAITGAPVPRALVSFSARTVLTDAQGKFSFPEFTATTAYGQVTKPGYTSTLTPEASRQQIIKDLDSPIELKLYPDALLTGLVTGPDGLPLSRVQVQLSRLSFDVSGARWFPSGSAQTDVHGDYRFDVAAGRYRVTTGYLARSLERGEAVLPVGFPQASSSNTESFQVAPAEQKQINLRPRIGPVYPVLVEVAGGDGDRGLRLTASTATGSSFQLGAQRNGNAYTVQLPAGTFTLHASKGDREGAFTGEARVVVSSQNANAVTLQLAPLPSFPVEASYEAVPSTTTNSTSTILSLQQLNLSLRDLGNFSPQGYMADIQLTIHADRTATFLAPPGRYRLSGTNNGNWFVRSASVGVTDLFTDELVIAQASAGSPIRLVLSNAFGRLKGTVKQAGLPASAWIYLIAQQPSLTPYAEIYVQMDGSYNWSGPPGKYLAVPSSQIVRDDFRNNAFVRKFAVGAPVVEITTAGETSLDLTLAQEGVAR